MANIAQTTTPAAATDDRPHNTAIRRTPLERLEYAVIADAALQGLDAAEMRRRLTIFTNRPMIAVASSPAEMTEPEAQDLGFITVLYPPIEIEDLALALFALVSSWRATHPGEPWADEAAQSAG